MSDLYKFDAENAEFIDKEVQKEFEIWCGLGMYDQFKMHHHNLQTIKAMKEDAYSERDALAKQVKDLEEAKLGWANRMDELKEELSLSREAHDATRAANEKLLEERDSLSDELKTLRGLFLDKHQKIEELEQEVRFLRGFQEAVHLMCGAKKPY